MLEEKSAALVRLEADRGEEERRGEEAEEAVRRARNKIEALAKGMTTDEHGDAVSLDAQLTGSSISQMGFLVQSREVCSGIGACVIASLVNNLINIVQIFIIFFRLLTRRFNAHF